MLASLPNTADLPCQTRQVRELLLKEPCPILELDLSDSEVVQDGNSVRLFSGVRLESLFKSEGETIAARRLRRLILHQVGRGGGAPLPQP